MPHLICSLREHGLEGWLLALIQHALQVLEQGVAVLGHKPVCAVYMQARLGLVCSGTSGLRLTNDVAGKMADAEVSLPLALGIASV